ncbi:ABC transporter substrate-binding protein [Actinotalea sp. Marseille-Q4924]|uniref:ABC transporter substrate-binding protein n=1 Tax=Actinotalea sp. Marseille-Q4924 TaxID=2866571 RepID=UPI001CE4B2BE|nr:extracellular solute-binding protein [Actinotalea sp. Marseille-Q4924]
MRTSRTGKSLALIICLPLALAACGSPTTDETSDDGGTDAGAVGGDQAAVCEAGAEEGTVVFWGSEEDATQQKLEADFAAAHPGIDVEFQSLRPEDITQRLVLEAGSGRASEVDVIEGNLDAFEPLVERDLVQQDVDWTSLGVRESLITETGMVRNSRIANGLVYNPDVTQPEDLPETWEELIDPKWAGTVVVDPRGNPLQALALEWGVDETVDYVERMKETVQPVVIEGGTAGMLTVASGENELTTNGRSAETLEQQAQGSPLEIHYLDVIPTSDFYQVVLADAPHPNAAACWVGWLVGEEGAAKVLEYAYKGNDDIPAGAPEDAVIAAIETAEEVDLAADAAAQIAAIWASLGTAG